MRRIWLPIAFLGLAALAMAVIAWSFAVSRQDWTGTDNAQLAAPTYQVVAPAAGRIAGWTTLSQGSQVGREAVLGSVTTAGGSLRLVTPHGGRLVGDYGYPGELVAQGQEVALVADLSRAYVLAYVDEGGAGHLRKGQTADLRFASRPDTVVQGKVARIYPAVASIVWPVPAMSQGQAFSKSAQWVPVRIALPNGANVPRYLGMSVSVRIAIGGGGQ